MQANQPPQQQSAKRGYPILADSLVPRLQPGNVFPEALPPVNQERGRGQAVDFDAIYPFLPHAFNWFPGSAWESITGGSASSHGRTQKLHELLAPKNRKVYSLGRGCETDFCIPMFYEGVKHLG